MIATAFIFGRDKIARDAVMMPDEFVACSSAGLLGLRAAIE
jgi:hypothetical protein